MKRRLICATLLLLVAGCASTQPRPASEKESEAPRLFSGMGDHHRKVQTASVRAQRYFDQGLTWAYAFNHDEAIRSFSEAARLDPNLAIAWWGVALCNGPHINNPMMSPAQCAAANAALRKAKDASEHATPVELALIGALTKRYADPPPSDRTDLDRAYANAMHAVWQEFPNDNDVGVLYAEALMDLQPWDLWTQEKQPKGNTREIVAVLEKVLARDSNHPGANHLYIHASEASDHADQAIASANRLRTLVPLAGHLVHMPAHIDVHVGGWAAAANTNEAAIKSDRKYRELRPRQGFYNIYMAHNHQFLSWAAMMEGRHAVASQAAADMLAGVPEEFVKTAPQMVDGPAGLPLAVQMRFGDWDGILAAPPPPACFPVTTALWRFERGVAYAARSELDRARAEQAEFAAASEKVPAGTMLQINSASAVLAIAKHVLAGEIAYREGKTDDAVRELQAGVAAEDQLRYMEPPEWIQPVRHTLGAVLVSAGRYPEAEKVYREDLKVWPENGWSLYGLATCLREQGAQAESDAVEQRFGKAWLRADTKIGSTCLCVKGRPATR